MSESNTIHIDHTLRNIGITVGLVLQFSILIWGASQIKASVDMLNRTMTEVRADLRHVTDELVQIKVEHARLEGTTNGNKSPSNR